MLELVLVTVLTATLAGLAIPRMTASNQRARVEQAADRVERIILESQEWARDHSSAVAVRIRVDTNMIERRYDGVEQKAVSISGDPYRARFLSVSFAGSDTFTIDGWGQISSAGKILIESGSAQSTITVPGPTASGNTATGINLIRSADLDSLIDSLGITD